MTSLRVSPARITQLSAFLSSRIGLHFPENRSADLERGMVAAAEELGFHHVDSCIDWLLATPLKQAQIETLASHLTIGETYLMREVKTFTALEEKVLPELIRVRRSGGRHLRLWSAGCASGEEAYSLAITVARLLPDLRDWRVSILGTDINPAVLRRASEGVYGEWSFRMTPAWVKERYFEPVGEKRYRIDPAIRRLVTFEYLNLAEDVFPSILTQTNAMDVIFCRNVLLYFSSERAVQVVGRFRHALVEGGWLAGGLAEQFQASGFVRVPFEGTTLFRNLRPDAVPPQPAPRMPKTKSRSPRSASACPPSIVPRETVCRAPSVLARESADAGRLTEALMHCDQAIAEEKMAAAHHYLRASILTEAERLIEAGESLRRALYLDPRMVLAHFALARLARKQECESDSRRHLENAFALLDAYAPHDILPESDGMTAGRLAEIIRATLSAQPT